MIFDPTLLAAYLVVAFAVAISPGPDFLFVIASGMRHQAKGAIASALGIVAGSFVHAALAAAGVSALIAASPLAFDALRYIGAAYLVWLGFQALRSFYRNQYEAGATDIKVPSAHVFRQALITNLLNPKVIIFYLALLPQFVSVELGRVGLQIFLLGSIHAFYGLVILLTVGFAAGHAASWLRKTAFARWLDGFAGLFFIGLAVRLAVSGRASD